MEANPVAIIVPCFILAIPILDIVFSSFRRILKGVSPFKADSEHIHHKLLHAGFSQNMTVLILVSAALCFGLIASVLMKTSLIKYGISALLILTIMLILSVHARYTSKKQDKEIQQEKEE